MLTYTSHMRPLILPEYGRNIQRMVDHCLSIENREERTAAANAIIKAMQTLFPNPGGNREEYLRKLWDHLMIMSDFKLDVDCPYEKLEAAKLITKPESISRPGHEKITFRHYGAILEEAVAKAAQMEDGVEKTELVFLLASQMKKIRTNIDGECADDERIFNDLHYLSRGSINVPRGAMELPRFQPEVPVTGSKRKRRK